MRFNLQDVKKSIHRRSGELSVSLHFLSEHELQDEITQLIAYHERLLGQPYHQFSLDEVRGLIGDYRLAQCLYATLSHWYSWQPHTWTDVLQAYDASGTATQLLQDAQISSPAQLRLALYTYVNEQHHGFLNTQQRGTMLTSFATLYQLQAAQLEYLLAMDSEDEAILTRNTSTPPTVSEAITLYNQWAFEAALLQASSVRFVIDCTAFGRASTETTPLISTGVGAVIKRLCYLARKMGVYYDLAYEEGERTMQDAPRLLLTLYGPQEVTGTAQQYGLRLARLCRLLLGYSGTTATGRNGKKTQKANLATGVVSAEATIHFLQRTYMLAMDSHLLRFLHAKPDESEQTTIASVSSDTTLFDSGIEQAFAEAFSALAQGQSIRGVHGWQLEREPEPLLLEQSIFIPDFALTRPPYRIYMEILGFWTPSYRERKVQKLQALQERRDIVLAIPIEAKVAFASIAPYFPIIYYDGQLSASEVISVLESHYDDFAERFAQMDVSTIRALVQERGLLSERDCYELLHCYRRSELQEMAERVIEETNTGDLLFVAGVGLYAQTWMGQIEKNVLQWIAQQRQTATIQVGEVFQELRRSYPMLASCEDTTLEALISCWTGIQLNRTSIFDLTLQIIERKDGDELKSYLYDEIESDKFSLQADIKVVNKRVRERHVTTKKRSESEVTHQEDLWENIE